MTDALWFLLSIVVTFVWGVVVIRSIRRRGRERDALIAKIQARPSTVVWITEDDVVHSSLSRETTAKVLEEAARGCATAPPHSTRELAQGKLCARPAE